MGDVVFRPTCRKEWNATRMVKSDKYDAETVEEVRCRRCGGKPE